MTTDHKRSRSFICYSDVHFACRWNDPRLFLLPAAAEHHHTLATFRPAAGRRLSWSAWTVTHRCGLRARRRSPIPVLTAPGVE